MMEQNDAQQRQVRELQLALAELETGRPAPVLARDMQLVRVTMQVSAETVRRAPEDAATDHAVEHLRRQLAVELTRRQMRPLDPWPAVTVRRLVWGYWSATVTGEDGDVPVAGMRELHPDDPQSPDLFQLELRTPAVPDLRPVVL